MKVFVYKCLGGRKEHRGKWSVKALEGEHKGKVIAHLDRLTLENCEFKVSESGRKRVLREKSKNVHAGVEGELVTNTRNIPINEATYNPYKYESFVDCKSQKPVSWANLVYMDKNKGVYYQ